MSSYYGIPLPVGTISHESAVAGLIMLTIFVVWGLYNQHRSKKG